MKGLFIKDLKLMKGQKQFFAIVLVMMILFSMSFTNYTFVICYVTIMMGVLTLTTISYDEYENGMGYLFTLPISRKKYVAEKYLFSIVTTILGLTASSAVGRIAASIQKVSFPMEEWFLSIAASILFVMMMLSLLLPIQLKLGADRSKVAMMIVYGGGFLIAYAGVKICDALGIDWKAGIDRIVALGPTVILTGLFVICGIIMVISFLFSLRFMKKREF